MQDNGQIASAFAAWQRAHQKLCDAEGRLATATDAWKLGRQPRPDDLHKEVIVLKAEQDLRYDIAAEALRTRRATGAAPLGAAGPRHPGAAAHTA